MVLRRKSLWLMAGFAILVALALVAGCARKTTSPSPTTNPTQAAGYTNGNLLADTDWLSQHLDDANVRVVDVRKAADYQGAHIKGSVNIDTMDFKGPMYDQSNPIKWTVLPKDKLEKLLGDSGIGNNTTVVVVDDARMLWASRFFWTLEYYGHGDGKTRVLNGGLKKWQAENRPLVSDPSVVKPAVFVAKPVAAKLATKQQVLDTLANKAAVILATIPLAEFQGGNKSSAARGGHIPGALQLDWTENLTGDPPVFKPATDLSQMYDKLGFTKDKNGIVY